MSMDATQTPVQGSPIPRIVTVGRAGLTVAAIIALLAAILDLTGSVTIPFLLRLFGALALLACATAGMIRPMRALDLGAVALSALLAGAASIWAFNSFDTSVISLFAWFLLLGFGGAVASGLVSGPPVVDRAFSDQMTNLFSPPPAAATPAAAATPTPPAAAAPPPPPAPTEPEPKPAPAASPAPSPPPPPPAATAPQADAKPAGWYAQEDGLTARWWDGSSWTEHTRALPNSGTQQ